MPTPPTNYFVFSTLTGVATARVVTRWGVCPADEVANVPLDASDGITTHATYAPVLTEDQEIVFNQTTSTLSVRTRTKGTGQLTREALREVARLLRNSDAAVTTDAKDLSSWRRYSEWLTYRKLLRAVPTQATFPATIAWPVMPAPITPLPPLVPFFRISAADPKTWGALTTTRAGAVATRWNRQGLMETVAANKTRVDFDPVTGVVLGFMSEPAATNVCLQSQSIGTTPWTQTRSTVLLANRAGPFGTSTMTKLMSDATAANTHVVSQNFDVATAGLLAWVTIHVAAGEYPGIGLALTNPGMTTVTTTFNAVTGVMTPANSMIATKKTNGIWELTTYCTPQSTGAGALVLNVQIFDGTSVTFNGDTAKGVFVDCCQVEFGQFPTSYITTTTAAVTRNADQHDLIFTSDDFTPAAFSVYCEAQYNAGALFGPSGSRYAFAIDNGTANQIIGMANLSFSANGLRIVRNGTTEVSLGGSRPGEFVPVAAAARIVPGDIAICNNGTGVVTSTAVNIPQFALISPRLKLGRNSAGNYLGGRVRELAIYCVEQLSDAQLIALAA